MKSMLALGTALLAVGMFTGCAPAAHTSSPDAAESGDSGAASASGTVSTDGSTSMEKMVGALGEAFTATGSGITVTYNPTGSSSGIQAVGEGRCDIGLSSRELRQEEETDGLVGTVVAYDGIALIVNPENPVSDLTLGQVADIYTGRITNWSEVGGDDAEIVLIGREAGSGTRDGFESVTDTEDACKYRQKLTSTGDVVATVSANPGAVGYASLAAVSDDVQVVDINSVTPSEQTIRDGAYVLSRPFLFVTSADRALSADAQKVFDYCMSGHGASVISDAGAVPTS